MKLFSYGKDGGPESTVHGYWLVEIKRLFSAVLLKFENGSRDAYHTHAFNCISWVLKGKLVEKHFDGSVVTHGPSIFPVITKRSTFHKVESDGTTWVLSLRGPWARNWMEFLPSQQKFVTLETGRITVKESYK